MTSKERASNWRKFSKYYLTTKGRACFLLNNARVRARRQGLKCTLTQAWIQRKLDAGVCEVTGISLQFNVGNGKGSRVNSFSPSLDRIRQGGHYTPKNVRVTCWILNRARGAFPAKDFDRMLAALAATASN